MQEVANPVHAVTKLYLCIHPFKISLVYGYFVLNWSAGVEMPHTYLHSSFELRARDAYLADIPDLKCFGEKLASTVTTHLTREAFISRPQ